ncbi:DUF4097 domain-containing protein [Thalassotalea sp. M1531]|uniref:DUF4097 domain-containing protein n=2 Tax=Thalassotalea algicola TaxID=2716224 RepID=A0A7Y0LAT5_9GAMM|nr:DUF4097 domain-containing protein [Thalassotalea algicola]
MANLLSLSILTVVLSGCMIQVNAKSADVTLQENLSLDAGSLNKFDIEAGAGSLEIRGDASSTEIQVQANIRTTEDKNYTLELDQSGSTARLVAKHHSHNGSWYGSSPKIDLIIIMPDSLMLDIDDGSGEIEVSNIGNALNLKDGSGSATIENIKGNVKIDDGSGGLTITGVQGNIELEDGSGSLVVSNVTGNVEIDDGSGSLSVKDVSGKVTIDDGSGGISVKRAGALKIIDAGSGGLSISDIEGETDIDS